jgi:hypothetical protein
MSETPMNGGTPSGDERNDPDRKPQSLKGMLPDNFNELPEWEQREIVKQVRELLPPELRTVEEDDLQQMLDIALQFHEAELYLAEKCETAEDKHITVHRAAVMMVLMQLNQYKELFGRVTQGGRIGPDTLQRAVDRHQIEDVLADL